MAKTPFFLIRILILGLLFSSFPTSSQSQKGEASPFSLAPSSSKLIPSIKGEELSASEPLRHFGVEDGLMNSSVRCAMVDRKGYLWIGTDGGGVFRYDGQEMVRFDEKDGLAGDRVIELFQDRSGTVWIGSIMGLTRYDGQGMTVFTRRDKCEQISNPDCHERLSERVIYDITQDSEGNIWLTSAGGGVMRFAGDSTTYFVPEGGCPPDSILKEKNADCIDRLPSSVLRTVIEGPEGLIWMGTFKHGMVAYDGKDFTYYGNKKGCLNYSEQYEDTVHVDVGSNVFWASHLDSKDRLWFGTPQGMLRKGKMGWEKLERGCKGNFHPCKKLDLWDVLIRDIDETEAGNFWLGSYAGAGRIVNDTVRDVITTAEGASDQLIVDVEEGKHGTIWLGTRGGLDQSLSNAIEIFDKGSGVAIESVNALQRDGKGRVWIGASDGDGSLDLLLPGDSIQHLLSKKELEKAGITDLAMRNEEEIWLSTSGGGIFSYERGKVQRYKGGVQNEKIPNNNFMDLHWVNDSVLWAAGEEGVTRFADDTTQRFKMEDGLNHPHVQVLVSDKKGRPWLGTPLRGINIYENGDFISLRKGNSGMRSEEIRDMKLGPKGNMWVATYGGGVHRLSDPQKIDEGSEADWSFIMEKDGLPSNSVNGIHFDEKGRLWAGTDLGAARIDPKREEVVYTLTRADGFMGLQCTGAITSDPKGRVLFGTSDHLIRFDPSLHRSSQKPPSLYIEEVSIDHKSTDWKEDRDSLREELGISYRSTDDPSIPEDLVLPYHRSRAIFHFQAIDLRAPNAVRYRYRLKGADEEWSPWQKHRKAIYNDLKPGDYTFQLEAKGRNGVKSRELKSYSFRVAPPWWRTIWFRASSIGGSILLILALVRWRTATIRKRKVELEAKVEERTLDLEERKMELEEQREELAEKNKEISDSIDYASSIQSALLPGPDQLKAIVGSHFVLYCPRDPVSGDFYWCYAPDSELSIWIVADCTGHGVPGGFMSMMGNSLLDEVVVKEGERDPGRILDRLRKGIIEKIGHERRKDGMDAAVCVWDRSKGELGFSGAQNPLYLIRDGMNGDPPPYRVFRDGKERPDEERAKRFKDHANGMEFKGDKQAVALSDHGVDGPEPFRSIVIPLEKGDRLYTFSDGFPDQFGGPKDKKYGFRNFKKLLAEHSDRPMQEQQEALKKILDEWKGRREQVDDICVMGVLIEDPKADKDGG